MILASILLGWLACGITCLAAGLAAVRAFRLDLNRAEALCLGFALGAALTSTLSLALAFLFAARAGVFLGLAALAAALLWRQLPWLRSLKPADWRSIPAAFRYLVAVVWAAYGGLYLLHAMEPAIAPDTYHLGFVNQWNLAHGMTRIVDCYAALPQGLEMLYLFAFSIGRDSGAVLVHYLFLMALPAAMLLYGVRFGIGRGGAAFAAIVVFVTPTVGWDGSIAYNDVALALAVLTTLYLFQIWRSGRSAGVLAAAGLMAGYCIAIKYTGALALIPLFAAALWDLRRDLRAAARAFLILTAAAAAFPAPYLVRNWLWYGNPIAFFGNAIFPNPYFSADFERGYIHNMAHFQGVTWGELPRELTFGGPKLFYNLGPIYALAPIALAGLVWRRTRLLTLAALAVAAGYAGDKDPRFLIPALPLLLLAVGVALSRLPRGAWALWLLAAAQALLIWPGVSRHSHRIHVSDPTLAATDWRAALRLTPEDKYLARFDTYRAARAIEQLAPANATVLALAGGVATSYTDRTVLDSYHSTASQRASSLFFDNENTAANWRWRWVAAFPRAAVREIRIRQQGRSAVPWSIGEIRLLRNGMALAPRRDWRAEASPNQDDADLMLDGAEWTRWTSSDPARPGMYAGVRLEGPVEIDGIEVVSGNGPWDSKMDMALTGAAGRALPVLSGEWRSDPPRDDRAAAAHSLKQRGIGYVFVVDIGYLGPQIRRDAAAWGLRELFHEPGQSLYQIE